MNGAEDPYAVETVVLLQWQTADNLFHVVGEPYAHEGEIEFSD